VRRHPPIIFFGNGLHDATKPIVQAIENLANRLPTRYDVFQFVVFQQLLANRLGGDPRVGKGRLKFGIGLSMRIDDPRTAIASKR
jgi:hypothetical protein